MIPVKHLSWHELVQPGPKGSPQRRAERLERKAERLGTVGSAPANMAYAPRAERRAMRKGTGSFGRLVQHRSRITAQASRQPLWASPTSRLGKAQRGLTEPAVSAHGVLTDEVA